jgi:hypothetical protein
MESAPPLEHALRFHSGLRRCIHGAPVGRHDMKIVLPRFAGGTSSEQPTPVEGAQTRNEPEPPAYDRQARLHDAAACRLASTRQEASSADGRDETVIRVTH